MLRKNMVFAALTAGGPSFFCEWIGWEGAGESESKRNATGVAELQRVGNTR